jgi:hypothetical protein
MDADDFEALFGSPPPPSTKSPTTTHKTNPNPPRLHKEAVQRRKNNKKHKKKSKDPKKTPLQLNPSPGNDQHMGPLSPKFTSGKHMGHGSVGDDDDRSSAHLFQAVLLVTLKKNTAAKSHHSATIVPTISQCFPRDTLSRLPSRIEHFCFPDVTTIVPLERQAATSFTFVLTAGDGARTYGFCRRYLPCGRAQQVRLDVGKRLPECLCILSSYPYFPVFDYVLKTLQVRRWLAPTSMAPFLIQLRNHRIPKRGGTFTIQQHHVFTRPMDDRVPLTSHGVRTFFTRFTPSLVRHILGAVLLEKRIIFHSTSIGRVSRVIYTALAMLYPFEWQHILVPLLPNDLLEYTCAPSPYVVGIHTSNIKQVKTLPIGEVLIVSVDTGQIVAYGNYESIPIGAASRGRTGSGSALAAAELVKGIGKEMFGGVRGVLTGEMGGSGGNRSRTLPSVQLTKTFEKLYEKIVATKNNDDDAN